MTEMSARERLGEIARNAMNAERPAQGGVMERDMNTFAEHMDDMQEEVGRWGRKTFPLATPHTIISHFREESTELIDRVDREALASYGPSEILDVAEEAADCVLLLMHLADQVGFSLSEAVVAKHETNRRRRWETAPTDGRTHWKHVAN
jgi:NTP pyrophosphatase (non-canonical NTP hydrolase)